MQSMRSVTLVRIQRETWSDFLRQRLRSASACGAQSRCDGVSLGERSGENSQVPDK
ncbi:hypothetical protein chiPu_0028866, partial [Chiloscyllium punctatum]|nr:hypothetical protein [Chiloscyllium punctatum]